MSIYIYGLLCPVELIIRYVGKTTCPSKRLSAHIKSAQQGLTDHHTARWIRLLLASGERPTLVILHEVQDGERWQDIERNFIATAPERGWRLTNTTLGGEGLDYALEEDKKRWIKNLSAAMAIVRSSPEWRAKVSDANIASWADPEIRDLRIAGMAAANGRPEVKAPRSAVITEINARPGIKAAQVARLTAEWSDPVLGPQRRAAIQGASEQMSESAQARWADPVKATAGKAALQTGEFREKMRQIAVDRTTPEYRALQAERTRKSWETRNRVRAPASQETKDRISAALAGRPHSPERIAAISAGQTGKKRGPQSPEHIAKRLESKLRTEALKRQNPSIHQDDLPI